MLGQDRRINFGIEVTISELVENGLVTGGDKGIADPVDFSEPGRVAVERSTCSPLVSPAGGLSDYRASQFLRHPVPTFTVADCRHGSVVEKVLLQAISEPLLKLRESAESIIKLHGGSRVIGTSKIEIGDPL